ncbi:uncharacterized protein LOC6573612 [Drosophila mojavensis]|uniref:Uncharacterized protein, isoform A n=1 Tax=Drosophila mojavensis TaxID=7230 RepID=B4K5S7_DROMO|nr:uncharacterized protein LOC6573612 [Drosophila mojavensis]XP_043863477.1 uncharacterized protein LOC6573612 [Drosophila mojavensis]EDW15139.1 uncharacterized protein Dmoj_GI22940, isoform A [Drosophila mojavensis]KRG01401.1 uncharacterized protein Dmoj_GI22940, isoform B [Drosophila mojavensis]
MANNHTVTRLLQVHEEAAPAVHIPILVGNEVFVVVQQDIRRTEDIRKLSYTQVLPNPPNHPFLPIFNQLNANAFGSSAPVTQLSALQALLLAGQAQNASTFPTSPPCPDIEMESNPTKTVADVSNQLHWSKQPKCTSPYPINYSTSTSTSGLLDFKPIKRSQRRSADKRDGSCQTWTKSTATDAGSQTTPQPTTTVEVNNVKKTQSSGCLPSSPNTQLKEKTSEKSLSKRRSLCKVMFKSKTQIPKETSKETKEKDLKLKEVLDKDKTKVKDTK